MGLKSMLVGMRSFAGLPFHRVYVVSVGHEKNKNNPGCILLGRTRPGFLF